MNLAQLIRKALIEPSFRVALESGTISAASQNLSEKEMSAVLEALRNIISRPGGNESPVPINVFGHRDDS